MSSCPSSPKQHKDSASLHPLLMGPCSISGPAEGGNSTYIDIPTLHPPPAAEAGLKFSFPAEPSGLRAVPDGHVLVCLALLHEANASWDAWPLSIKDLKVVEKRSLSGVIHGPCWLGPLSAAAAPSPAGI